MVMESYFGFRPYKQLVDEGRLKLRDYIYIDGRLCRVLGANRRKGSYRIGVGSSIRNVRKSSKTADGLRRQSKKAACH